METEETLGDGLGHNILEDIALFLNNLFKPLRVVIEMFQTFIRHDYLLQYPDSCQKYWNNIP